MNGNDDQYQEPLPGLNDVIHPNPLDKLEPEISQTLTDDEKERIILEELAALLTELSTLKEQGNISFKNNNFIQAEETYSTAINKINTYTPSQAIAREVPQIFGLINEMQKLLITLLGNLSMALSKQNKYKQAIEKVLELDPSNEKSYSRLLQWLIANGEIEKANYIAKDIRNKFSYNLQNFQQNLDSLDNINKQYEMQHTMNKGKKNKNNGWLPWIAGGVALIASGLLVTLVIKKNKGLI